MTAELKTRKVNKSLYRNYLKRAEECFMAANESLKNADWNAAAICAVHACISACDAMCIYFLGNRHAGGKHSDAVRLFKTIRIDDENLSKNSNRLSRILRIKNMAEYEERLVYKSEAEKTVKDMERFFSYVKKELL
jgi:HEPN domain-containing protein